MGEREKKTGQLRVGGAGKRIGRDWEEGEEEGRGGGRGGE